MATAPTSRAGSWPTKPSAGYTFLELTVVITIILMAVAIGVPRLLSWVNEGNLGAECRRLAGTIRYVRNEAARRRTSFFLTLDLENAAYWIDVRRDPSQVEHRGYYVSWEEPEDRDFEAYEDDFVSRRELRRRITFERVVDGEGGEEHYGKARIEFRPDGTTETVAIYMATTDQRVATVILNGDTGRVNVYDYREELEPPPVLYERYDFDE